MVNGTGAAGGGASRPVLRAAALSPLSTFYAVLLPRFCLRSLDDAVWFGAVAGERPTPAAAGVGCGYTRFPLPTGWCGVLRYAPFACFVWRRTLCGPVDGCYIGSILGRLDPAAMRTGRLLLHGTLREEGLVRLTWCRLRCFFTGACAHNSFCHFLPCYHRVAAYTPSFSCSFCALPCLLTLLSQTTSPAATGLRFNGSFVDGLVLVYFGLRVFRTI